MDAMLRQFGERDPRIWPLGLYHSDPAGHVRGFLWFDSPEEMIDYLLGRVLDTAPPALAAAASQLRDQIAESLESGGATALTAVQEMSRFLPPQERPEWCGHYPQLLVGSGYLVSSVRAGFRYAWMDDGTLAEAAASRPIEQHDEARFVSYLRSVTASAARISA